MYPDGSAFTRSSFREPSRVAAGLSRRTQERGIVRLRMTARQNCLRRREFVQRLANWRASSRPKPLGTPTITYEGGSRGEPHSRRNGRAGVLPRAFRRCTALPWGYDNAVESRDWILDVPVKGIGTRRDAATAGFRTESREPGRRGDAVPAVMGNALSREIVYARNRRWMLRPWCAEPLGRPSSLFNGSATVPGVRRSCDSKPTTRAR